MATKKHMKRLFHKIRKTRTRSPTGREEEEPPTTTFDGLQMWFKSLYEELGWMVLAKEMGYKDKIRGYKAKLRRFDQSLAIAERELQDPDHLRDLQIMKDKIKILEKHVHKDF
jgi:hypothetical protein